MKSEMNVADINWHGNVGENAVDDVLAGDIIVLKGEDGGLYHFRCECIEVDEKAVRAVITAVFDWVTKNPILGGHITTLAGKEITLPTECIFEAAQKPKK